MTSDVRATRFTAPVGLAPVAPAEPAVVGLFLISDVRNDERSRLERRNRVRLKKFSTIRGLNMSVVIILTNKPETNRSNTHDQHRRFADAYPT